MFNVEQGYPIKKALYLPCILHIFTKFAGNVYGYENLSLKNFSLILKNKMSAIANCLKIVKVL